MKKPVIGVAGNKIAMDDGMYTGSARHVINSDYVKSIELGGGIPMLIPVFEDEDEIDTLVRLCDGILIPGGVDVSPWFYGEEPSQKLDTCMPVKDKYDFMLIKSALKHKKPLLGICRGIQIINVVLGGTLYQDVHSEWPDAIRHVQTAPRGEGYHRISVEPGSILSEIIPDNTRVNSWHHQSVKDPGKNVKVTAHASDGIIEAIEYTEDDNFVLAVQWHPEMMTAACGDKTQVNIFKKFVEVCAERRGRAQEA